MRNGVDELVGVPNAEARKDHLRLVSVAVGIGITKVEELIEIADIHSAVAGLQALDHREAFGVAMILVGVTGALGVFENKDEIRRLHARHSLRIGGRASDIQTSILVPGHLRGLGDAFEFGGEEIDLIPFRQREGGLLLVWRHDVLGLRGRRLRRHRRGLLAKRHGLNAAIHSGDERLAILEALAEGWSIASGFAEELRDAVAIDEGPVRGTPAVEPEAVLLNNGIADRHKVSGGGLSTELFRNDLGDDLKTFVGQMNAVAGEARCFDIALGEGSEDVDEHGVAMLRDVRHGLCISRRVIVALGEIRRIGSRRFLKRHRRDQNEARCAGDELVEQTMIGRGELRQAIRSIEGFHLAELGNDDGRTRGFELAGP